MRSLLIVVAGACASAGTSLAVWAAVAIETEVFCEVASGGLVRTNVHANQVNLAVSDVLEATRPYSADREMCLVNSEYDERTRAWFSESDFMGGEQERACQLVREQNDEHGGRTRIEILHGLDMPSLVFVEHPDSRRLQEIVELLAERLRVCGAAER